eukprot:INCI10312.1.p1 GENE.INCI10312.1~~INCI10312.1.p1  ORF type:complete len:341 (-),score=69.77 INCI10312.1:6-1028(-)
MRAACMSLLSAALVVVSHLTSTAHAALPPAGIGKECQALTPDTFSSFVAENPVALFQVHDGTEILANEIADALTRISQPIAYATLDASLSGNAEILEKLDRSDPAPPVEFFVFRNGLPHNKLPRLRRGLSADAVEEVLVYLSLEVSSLEDAAAAAGRPDDDFPLWSIHHGRDNFEEILTEAEFEAALSKAAPTDITVVQFFSRWCKYCQLFSFEWHKVANEFAINENLNFLRVDGNTIENTALIERFGVNGFPTIKFFAGKQYDSTYNGERTANAMKEHLVKMLVESGQRRRRPDGSFNLQANLPGLLRNLERLYGEGALSEDQYLARKSILQKSGAVTE